MQLRELDPALARELEDESTPESALKRLGYTILGSGHHAAVATRPGAAWVLKVFDRRDSYPLYVEYAVKHRDNPHVPRFYTDREAMRMSGQTGGEAQVIIEIDDWFRAVHMERLKPVSWDAAMLMFRPELYGALLLGIKLGRRVYRREIQEIMEKRLVKMLALPPDHLQNLRAFAQDTAEWPRLWTRLQRAPSESWMALVEDLTTMAHGSRGRTQMDLSEDNIMLRGNTLVLTDPVA